MEVQYLGYIFECNYIHGGQYYSYGDFFRIYEITTNCPNENIVVDMVKTVLRPNDKNVPVKEEWDKLEGPDNYFRGYYTIEKIPNGWRYTKCEPYTD